MTHRLPSRSPSRCCSSPAAAEDEPERTRTQAAVAVERRTRSTTPTRASISSTDPSWRAPTSEALQTYVDFERGRRLAAREGAVGRLLSFNATASVVDPYREALAAYDRRSRTTATW